ncbi:hypothetical protein SK128_016550 [Halocaridina rubra]|uniref:Uncharacterized protein n=1 Tax=Halocaridina rubra TaxID=373956 RepID=A0AAN8WVH7_HALRR
MSGSNLSASRGDITFSDTDNVTTMVGKGNVMENAAPPQFSISSILGLGGSSQRLNSEDRETSHANISAVSATCYLSSSSERSTSPIFDAREVTSSCDALVSSSTSIRNKSPHLPPCSIYIKHTKNLPIVTSATMTTPMTRNRRENREFLLAANEEDLLHEADEFVDEIASGDEDNSNGSHHNMIGDLAMDDEQSPLPSVIDHPQSAFVRPTPVHLRPDLDRFENLASLSGTMGRSITAEASSLGSTLAPASHLSPMWYPPWVAAFKPMFGLQAIDSKAESLEKDVSGRVYNHKIMSYILHLTIRCT